MSKKGHQPLVVGNWKMNPKTLGLARKLFLDTRTKLGRHAQQVDVVVAPPFPFISEMDRLAPSKRIALAAQDVFFEVSGAHTGEVSAPMLKSVGVSYVIIGHSEMRARGESDHDIFQDIMAVIKAGMVAIVCIGEDERDAHGNYFSVVEAQLRSAIRDFPRSKLGHLVVAYEPVWAIGTGQTATAADVQEMKLFIQKILTDHFGRSALSKVRIIYGGSVKKKNTTTLLAAGGVDGFLVGGASLRAGEFTDIVKLVGEHGAA